MKINEGIVEFSRFLNTTFNDVYNFCQKIEIEKRNIILADQIENGYLQFFWEIVIEKSLLQSTYSIEPYGDGADFYPTSSRVLSPEKVATHKIVVQVKNCKNHLSGNIVNGAFDFIKLISFNDGCYYQNVPFDFVLCDDNNGTKYVFIINDVDFVLQEV